MPIFSDAIRCSLCHGSINSDLSIVVSIRNGDILDYICLMCLKRLLANTN